MKLQGNSDKHKFKAEVWESSKGLIGFCGWGLWVYVPDVESWYQIDGSHRNYPLSPDNAERIARDSFDQAVNGGYQPILQSVFGKEPAE